MADEAKTIVVETTGDFMAQDPTNGQVVEAYGATEVQDTAFIRAQIDAGRLKESNSKSAKPASAPPKVEPLVESEDVEQEPEAETEEKPSRRKGKK